MDHLRYLYLSPAASHQPSTVMVFLHGYGSHGCDFLDVARILREDYPEMAFILPDAPTPLPLMKEWAEQMNMSQAFQWFDVSDFLNDHTDDKQKLQSIQKGTQEIFSPLETFLQAMAKTYHCTLEQMILFGFSQGGMIALDAGLRLPVKACIACASMLPFIDDFAQHYQNRCPILLCHGMADDVVPAQHSQEAYEKLKQEGYDDTILKLSDQTAHHLDADMLQAFKDFLRQHV